MIVFSCPECDCEMEVPDSKAGIRAKCGECGNVLQVPGAKATATQVSARKPAPKPVTAEESAPEESPRPKGRNGAKKKKGSRAKQTTPVALWLGVGASAVCAVGIGLFFLLQPSGKTDSAPKVVSNPPPAKDTNPNPPEVKPTPVEPVEDKQDKQDGLNTKVSATGRDIYQHVLTSTVLVINRVKEGAATGTGTLIDRENRLVLTNNHVVDGTQGLVVFFPVYQGGKLITDKETYVEKMKSNQAGVIVAKVLKVDERRDLALIQLEKVPEGARGLSLARKSVSPGDTVHSLGNPGQSGALWLYTQGTVRQVSPKKWKAQGNGKVYDLEAEVVETQSPTNPGDSGGPLVNDIGELVGVTQGGSTGASLLSIFIDVKEANDFIQKTCEENKLVWKPSKRALIVRRGSGNVPNLIKRLSDPDATARARAVQALAEIGPAAQLAVSALVKALKDSDELVRRLAREALLQIGTPNSADVPLLIECLKDEEVPVRTYAAGALGLLGAEARVAAPALLEALKDKEAPVRLRAARSLGQVGTDSRKTVLPVLTAALQDTDSQVRLAAAEALTTVAPLEVGDVPLLTGMLKHQDLLVRAVGARALGKLGAPAKGAIPALTAMLRDTKDRELRRAVIGALGQFGVEAKEAVPTLVDALKDPALRADVIQALASIGPGAKDAVKPLAEALADANAATRTAALNALGKIGPDARAAVPALAKLLDKKDKELRLQVLATLRQIGPGALGAVPALLKVAGEHAEQLHGTAVVQLFDQETHDRAVGVLAKIGKTAVWPLRLRLRDPNALIRLAAVTALGKIGPAALAAKDNLRLLAGQDPNAKVREAASTAYGEVTTKITNPPRSTKPTTAVPPKKP